jgi:outer membrane immunogenic protein
MRKLLLGGIALVAFSTAAVAADLPSSAPPPVYVPPPPVFSWTGGYAGVNAGYTFDNRQTLSNTANDPVAQALIDAGNVSPFFSNQGNGFTGGGQIGYNYEFENGLFGGGGFGGNGGFVIGVEADAQYMGISRTTDLFDGTGFDSRFHSRTNFLGTVRGRLGYAFSNVLLYGTGGFAYGNVNNSITIFDPSGNEAFFGSRNHLNTGWTAGGGIEYALPTDSFLNFFHSSGVTVRAEYLYYNLGNSSNVLNGTGTVIVPLGSSFTGRIHDTGNLVRVGLNFKFGAAPPPVVARY